MADELDDILGMFAGDDATALRTILDRNAAAKAALEGRETVYQAFVGGDNDKIAALATKNGAVTTPAAAAAVDLDALNAQLDARMTSRFSSFATSPEFTSAVEARAKAIAEAEITAKSADLLGSAARTSDEIYTIRRSHEREFGTELDTTAFSTYLTANTGKFVNLSAAHDAYVQEQRIEARITKGVAEREAAKQTTEVPGSSLPTAQSPLGAMIRANPANAKAGERGTGIDAAVTAFRTLQTSHAN